MFFFSNKTFNLQILQKMSLGLNADYFNESFSEPLIFSKMQENTLVKLSPL